MVDDFTPAAILARDFPPKDFDVALLATVLGEVEPQPQAQLVQISTRFGPLATWRLLQKTLDVEAHGGVLVPDGTRRRTRGGTFFWLAQQWGKVTKTQRPFHYQPPIPTIARTVEALAEAGEHGGCTMKTTLVGRPGAVKDCGTYVTLKMSQRC